MTRWAGEMEFEFIDEGGEGGGSFVATDKLVQFLRSHLAKGEIEFAVRLYEDAGAAVGASLIEEAKTASSTSQKHLAEMFQGARDFKSAAQVYEIARQHELAGQLYEQAQDFASAAHCFEALGNYVRAGQAYERAGQMPQARANYEKAGPSDALAECLARQNHFLDAAGIYKQLGNLRGEIDMLRLVPVHHDARVPAVMRLSELLVQFGHPDQAVGLLVDTVRQCEAANKHQPLYMTLARILESLGRLQEAQQVRERISNILGGDNMQERKQLTEEAGVRPAPLDLGTAAPASTTTPPAAAPAPAPDVVTADRKEYSSADPFDSLSDPFSKGGGDQTAAEPGLPAVDSAYTHLKKIPIFAELDLQDMKDLYRICQQVQYQPGATLIEQGQAGAGLLVVVNGGVRVQGVQADGSTKELAQLGPGNYVGEISLIDDAPTSARVVAEGEVAALFISRDRFHQFLYGRDVAAMRIFRLFTRTLAERLRQSNLR